MHIETFPVILCSAFLAVFISTALPKYDGKIAWVFGIVLAIAAGFFTDGFDYNEYFLMIINIRDSAGLDLSDRIYYAKDPLFFLLVEIISVFTDDVAPIFVAVAAISVGSKVLATSRFSGHRTLFITLYAIFLAPGLEFAAIRTAMGLGFAMIAILGLSNWRFLGYPLALASHLSTAFVFTGTLARNYPKLFAPIAFIFVPGVLPFFIEYIATDPRYSNYLENAGSIFAFAWPIATSLVIFIVYRATNNCTFIDVNFDKKTATAVFQSSLICLVASLLLTKFMVTVSFRILELSWVLLLINLSLLFYSKKYREKHKTAMLSAYILWMSVLAASNLVRSTWSVLI